MDDHDKIAKRMKSDWNRRVSHDYRFWMSDGHQNDVVMWESGKRDLDTLFEGLESEGSMTALEIGCGVGRLLKHAVKRFGRVIGLDISETAISKARELLGDQPGLELIAGSGVDLQPIANESVDLAFSYAAITSIPTDIIARYFVELHRVLKKGGTARLQLYLGEEQIVGRNDTLHLRCYRREGFTAAIQAAGFSVEWIRELRLPFKVSFHEIGIEAVIVSLRKQDVEPENAETVSQLLLPAGEKDEVDEGRAAEVECWMALNYAKELTETGDLERARETIEYVSLRVSNTTTDMRDLLQRIVDEVERREKLQQPGTYQHTSSAPSISIRDSNLDLLKRRFPEVYSLVTSAPHDPEEQVAVQHTGDGPILISGGQCLDHPQKPRAGGDAWVKRVLQEKRFDIAEQIVVFGFASGYHIESLLTLSQKKIAVIEPSLKVFRMALEVRDLTSILSRVSGLSVGDTIEPAFIDSASELAVRPQTQVVASEYCARIRSSVYGKRGLQTLHPKIGILGPLQGGTLPMVNYCTRGLVSLKQRGRELDMSGFASGYHCLEQFAFEKTRVGVIQGTYIEMLSQVVLESLNEKPVDILLCMAQAPISGRVLQELRRRGIITVLWFVEDYLRFTYWKSTAQYYDFIFTIQKGDCLEQLKAAGAGEVHYLPVACDPVIHTPVSLTPEEKQRWGSPISFVGAGYHNRQQVFASFADMPFKLWGTEWPECRPFDRLVQEKGRRLAPQEYNKIFNATDVNINLHSSGERDGVDPFGDFVNPRTFELASVGAFQLVDERTLLPELFEPGKELVTFRDPKDLKDKIAYYLAHPEERFEIAQRGRERVLREHTYGHRLQKMLSIIYSSRFEKLKVREDASPWNKMLARSEKKDPELYQRCKASFERGEEPNLDGLVADIVTGKGKLSETEKKLLFLFHIRKQIMRMRAEEEGA